jgi:hypothetical protein
VGTRGIEWASGLFEGEGCVTRWRSTHRSRYGTKEYIGFRLAVHMTDLDVLEEFAKIAECGTIHKRNKANKEIKDSWVWQCQGEAAVSFAMKMMPYLFERRRLRIMEVMLEVHNNRENGYQAEQQDDC